MCVNCQIPLPIELNMGLGKKPGSGSNTTDELPYISICIPVSTIPVCAELAANHDAAPAASGDSVKK